MAGLAIPLPADLLNGAECWAMRMKEEHISNKNVVRMVRWIHCISLKDHASSSEIRKRAKL